MLGAPSESISPCDAAEHGPAQHRRLRQRRKAITQEMLDFCAEHDVPAETELIAADEINDPYQRVLDSDVLINPGVHSRQLVWPRNSPESQTSSHA